VFKHWNWGELVIELLYYVVCIQKCSGVLRLHYECASCAMGAAQGSRRPSCRVQDGVLSGFWL